MSFLSDLKHYIKELFNATARHKADESGAIDPEIGKHKCLTLRLGGNGYVSSRPSKAVCQSCGKVGEIRKVVREIK